MDQEKTPARPVPTSLFCVVFYFMGAMGIAFAVLPDDAFIFFGGRQPAGGGASIPLMFAGVFLAAGAILHLVFLRTDPERFDRATFRSAGAMMGLMLALFLGLPILLSRATGLPDAVLRSWFDRAMNGLRVGALGLAFLLIPGLAALLFLAIRYQPANRMARRLAANDAEGAIRIGEARLVGPRSFAIQANLVAAYAMAGRLDQARPLLVELESTGWDPSIGPEDQYRAFMDHLRGLVAGSTASPAAEVKDET